MPKLFVVLDQASFPKLPNGKPDLKEGELFLDSLGQMKKASKGELFENAVIHRCYAFWMLGGLARIRTAGLSERAPGQR